MLSFKEYFNSNGLGDLKLHSTVCPHISPDPFIISYGTLGNTHQADSEVHGAGLFASQDIVEGTTIQPTHFYTERYSWVNIEPNFRFNHSKTCSNILLSTTNNIKSIVALRDIAEGEELLADYSLDGDVEDDQAGWKDYE